MPNYRQNQNRQQKPENYRGVITEVRTQWGEFGNWVSLRVKVKEKGQRKEIKVGLVGNATMQPIEGDLFTAIGTWVRDAKWGDQIKAGKIEIFPQDLVGFMEWVTRSPEEGGAPGWGKEKKGMLSVLWNTADDGKTEGRMWGVLRRAGTDDGFTQLVERVGDAFARSKKEAPTLPTQLKLTKALYEAFRVQLETNPALIDLLDRGFGFKNSLNIAQKFGDDVDVVWNRNPYEFLVVPRVTYAVVTRAMDTALKNGDERFPFGCWQRVSGKAADMLQKIADSKGDTRVVTFPPDYIERGKKVDDMNPVIDIAVKFRGPARSSGERARLEDPSPQGLQAYFYYCLDRGGAVVPADGPNRESFFALPRYYDAEESIAVFLGLMKPTGRREAHGAE